MPLAKPKAPPLTQPLPIVDSHQLHSIQLRARFGNQMEVRALAKTWGVPQKAAGKNRSVLEMRRDLEEKIATQQAEPGCWFVNAKKARLQEISVLPYIGMVVNGVKCGLALVLVAATEKPELQKFGDGHRLIIKNVLDVGFGPTAMNPEDCRASATAKYDLIAICTEHNLTDYKMAPPRKAAAQYALLTVSSVRESAADAEEPGRKTFMVDRMQLIDGPDNVSTCQKMLGKLAHAHSEFTFEGTKRDRSAWGDDPVTPLSSAKKVRKLSLSPTDASLPGGS